MSGRKVGTLIVVVLKGVSCINSGLFYIIMTSLFRRKTSRTRDILGNKILTAYLNLMAKRVEPRRSREVVSIQIGTMSYDFQYMRPLKKKSQGMPEENRHHHPLPKTVTLQNPRRDS